MVHTEAQRCTSPKATGAPTPLHRVGGGALLHSPHGDPGAERLTWPGSQPAGVAAGPNAVQESGFLGRISRGGVEVSSQSPQVGGGKLRPRGPTPGGGTIRGRAAGLSSSPAPCEVLAPLRCNPTPLVGGGSPSALRPSPAARVPHHCAARSPPPTMPLLLLAALAAAAAAAWPGCQPAWGPAGKAGSPVP